jgi:IS605 OrfB family transposase
MRYLEMTVAEYRSFCNALSYVVMGHWVDIAGADSRCAAIEKLIHKTSKNPNPQYSYFGRRFYKFPCYLRRAAIEFVCGQVSSFLTRYRQWQGGIKVWNGSDWVWVKVQISGLRKRHLLDHSKGLSPSLVVRQGKAHLSVPFKLHPKKLASDLVCAVDVGMNTTATAAIISSGGTVVARRFFHRGIDIDRRDKVLQQVRVKAKQTKKLHQGFCKTLYRRAHGLNHNMAQHISKGIVQFALEHGASVIVFEDLVGWKPKAGHKRSNLKQRFHNWLHRLLVQLTENKFVEVGGSVELVYPRGTSSWAYDGSGQLKRSKQNYALATFQTGKQFNADLNGSYNIGGRYWGYKLKLAYRNGCQLSSSKSSGDKQRMPVTLSRLWDREAAHVRSAS